MTLTNCFLKDLGTHRGCEGAEACDRQLCRRAAAPYGTSSVAPEASTGVGDGVWTASYTL